MHHRPDPQEPFEQDYHTELEYQQLLDQLEYDAEMAHKHEAAERFEALADAALEAA